MMSSVFTGKCGLSRNLVSPWRAMKRRISRFSYAIFAGANETGEYERLLSLDPHPVEAIPPDLLPWILKRNDTNPEAPAKRAPMSATTRAYLIGRAIADAPLYGRNSAAFWLTASRIMTMI